MKKLFFGLVMGALVAGESQALIFHEWTNTSGGNGHLYTVVGETPDAVLAWPDALTEAEQLGGYLVSIESAAELSFLRNTFGNTELFWTGLNTGGGSGALQWSNGEPVNFTYFGGQAVDTTQDLAVVMNQMNSRGISKGQFGAVNPYSEQYRAIVEIEGSAPGVGVPDGGATLGLFLIAGMVGTACRRWMR